MSPNVTPGKNPELTPPLCGFLGFLSCGPSWMTSLLPVRWVSVSRFPVLSLKAWRLVLAAQENSIVIAGTGDVAPAADRPRDRVVAQQRRAAEATDLRDDLPARRSAGARVARRGARRRHRGGQHEAGRREDREELLHAPPPPQVALAGR